MYIEDDDDLIAVLDQLGSPKADPPELVRIFDGIADHDTTFELINRYRKLNPFRSNLRAPRFR